MLKKTTEALLCTWGCCVFLCRKKRLCQCSHAGTHIKPSSLELVFEDPVVQQEKTNSSAEDRIEDRLTLVRFHLC